jgi:hypothetical protein
VRRDLGTAALKLSQEFNGIRPVDVVDVGGGLICLTPTDAGVREYEPPIIARSIAEIRARLFLFIGGLRTKPTNRRAGRP